MSKFSVRLPAAEYYVISGPTYLPSAATKYHNCVIIALTYLPSAEYYVILECSLTGHTQSNTVTVRSTSSMNWKLLAKNRSIYALVESHVDRLKTVNKYH